MKYLLAFFRSASVRWPRPIVTTIGGAQGLSDLLSEAKPKVWLIKQLPVRSESIFIQGGSTSYTCGLAQWLCACRACSGNMLGGVEQCLIYMRQNRLKTGSFPHGLIYWVKSVLCLSEVKKWSNVHQPQALFPTRLTSVPINTSASGELYTPTCIQVAFKRSESHFPP